MHKECVIHHRRVPRSEIPAWNKIISDWGAACNEQVVLKENELNVLFIVKKLNYGKD